MTFDIEKLTTEQRKDVARFHSLGKYDEVWKILAKTHNENCDSCFSAYNMKMWCEYWLSLEKIPIIKRTVKHKMKIS